MDWRVRIACWVVAAVLVVSAVVPGAAARGIGVWGRVRIGTGGGGGSRGGTIYTRQQVYQHPDPYRPPVPKPVPQRNGGWSYGSGPEWHEPNYRLTPTPTTHRHRHGHGYHSPGGNINPFQTTQRPSLHMKTLVTGLYNKSLDAFGRIPGSLQPPEQLRPRTTDDVLQAAGVPVYVQSSHRAPPPAPVHSGTEWKPGDYRQQPAYNPSYPETQQAPFPYNWSYHSTQQVPPSYSPGYHGIRQAQPPHSPPGRAPPAYNPKHPPGGNRSSLFGYSKTSSRPDLPKIIFLPLPQYHYPNIPPRSTWGCDCYVTYKTAVCTYKLKDDHIPSCVNSLVTAVFIRSREVDGLYMDAFSHIPNLEYLNVTGTKLRSLPRDLFYDTRDLKHLLIQNNPELRYLHSNLFRGASKLEDVILDHNNISSLDRDLFTHLKTVKRLNLAYNKIRSLPKGIFRDNRELQELGLSGNPLLISSDTARDLLRNNAKLRVLLMRDCKLEDVPTGLLRNATNLEWLDLSSNEISKFPSEFIQDCSKLGYLGLAYNKLKVLGSDVLLQHGGSLTTLELEGNPWRCDCDLLPLAGWASLRKDAVPGRPECSSPHDVENEPLERWFHSKDVMKCGGATSSLRTDLNRVMSVARAIAEHGPTSFANSLPVSDKEVSFTATNYFLHAMAARTSADVRSVVWHWARFLEKVLDRRHLRHPEEVAIYNTNQIGVDRTLLIPRKARKDPTDIANIDFDMDPLTTTTTKPPAAADVERLPRPKGFKPLMNFTYIMKDVPQNLTKVVDDGIEEELKILFRVVNGTNATSPKATAAKGTALSSTGLHVTTASTNGMAVPHKKLNATEQMVAGLRSELREVLSTLLLSIDQAKWDAAYQKSLKEEEEKAKKSPQQPVLPVAAMYTGGGAESCILIQPRLTVLVAFLTVLVHSPL